VLILFDKVTLERFFGKNKTFCFAMNHQNNYPIDNLLPKNLSLPKFYFMLLQFIEWNVSPELFPGISWMPVRWYGVLFAGAFFFAAGQTIGPAFAGLIAEHYGSFAPAFLLSALITAVAMLFALSLPRPTEN
jgi:hypothetical protein